MNSASLRLGFAAAAAIAVAACSATGGQSSSVPGAAPGLAVPATGAAAAAPNRRHPRPPSRKAQRAVASAALSVAGAGVDLDQFGSANGLLTQLLHFGRSVAHTRHRPETTSSPTCQNGVEYSWSSTGFGQVSQTIEFFYDSACTEPYNLITLNATFTGAGGSAQGTQETWDQNGDIIGYQTYTATFTPGTSSSDIGELVIQKTTAPAPSTSPSSQSGYTCLFNTGNAVDCGSGTVTNVALASPSPEEVGFQQTVVGQFVTPSPGPSGSPSPWPSTSPWPSSSPGPSSSPWSNASPQWGHGPPGGGWQGGGPTGLQLQINGATYSGAIGALSLAAGDPPQWTIAGGTQDGTLTGTATIGFGGFTHAGWHGGGHHQGHWHRGGSPGPGAMTSIDLTLNDTADGLTVAIASAGSGQLTGAVTETATGQAVATMSLDFSGTGTITYTSGQVDQVQDWVIVN